MDTHPAPSRSARDRTVHRAAGFADAEKWDRGQHLSMTPDERRAAARELKRRAYPGKAPDVREWERRA